MAVHELIQQCPPLDTNSLYCNLLQCSHFAQTSVVAEIDGEVAGFISGYTVPGQEDTLFVWQVAVGEKARGHGTATKMLKELLARKPFTYLDTTITETNSASWALFEGLARKLDCGVTKSTMFDRKDHFQDSHDTEMLVRIGPFTPVVKAVAA